MIHIHNLDGCAPVPLAHYLKALGILRLVAEQADSEARGWWEGERFRLATSLAREEVETFFREEYRPTPLVAPWNGGTGFYPKDKKAGKAVQGIMRTDNQRFSVYQEAINEAYRLVGERKEAPDKKEKIDFLRTCLRDWRGPQREAMTAAVVLGGDDQPGYPSLLGTGYNDGRLDFTSNYMERLLEILGPKTSNRSSCLLREALWGVPERGMSKGAIGQFLPGRAGGANSSTGPSGDAATNNWDFVLMLEGAVLFVSHATRRLGTIQTSRAAAPFAVSAQGAGYASAADSDESARGEQWMPLWSQPMTLAELRRLLAEGRAQIGAKAIKEPLDLARAVARLGVARGITAFQRYGYIERNGQANLAVPLGRFSVPEQVVPQVACLDDLDVWLPRLRLDSRDTKTRKVPNRLKLAEHRLADAVFSVTQHPNDAACWQTLLLALAEVEAVLASGTRHRCGFIPRLRPEWVQAADDGSAELRLAVGLALQAAGFRRGWIPFDPVRRHWLPEKNQETAAIMYGRAGIDDAIALVERRLIEAGQKGQRFLPLKAARGASAWVSDLAALVTDEVDLDRTLALARVFMAIDGWRWAVDPKPFQKPERAVRWPDDAWLAIRLAMLPWPLDNSRNIFVDPAIVRRLASGDATSALELALRRLQAVGIRPTVRIGMASPRNARLWAVALAFPIDRNTAQRMVRRLDPNFFETYRESP
jgi:CRISPR-associated protein Csx17